MSLLVKLSLVEPIRKDVWLRAHLVMSIERDSLNPLISAVQTQILADNGQQVVLKCLDPPDILATAVNNALIQKPDPKAN